MVRAALVAVLLLAASSAGAQDIFALEPGKRIKGHQGIDCDKCHVGGSGIDRNKCLSCHDHQELSRRINAGKGLHATAEFAKPCEKCHLEHKGPNYDPIDWRPFGGMKGFDHGRTGYDLEGAHKRASCVDCHKAKYPQSGRTKFLGLDANCLSCHEDVHRFAETNKSLTECRICHQFDARTVTQAKGLRFDHGKVADFDLKGRHEETKCSNCHTSTTIFKMKDRPDRCADCHKDPHKNVYTAEARDCKTCHSEVERTFDRFKFAHGEATKFDLQFKHAKQKCTKCHEPTAMAPPAFACAGCHKKDSTHVVAGKDRFAGRDCMQCHVQERFAKLSMNHGASTGFPLGGKHASIGCLDCHRKKPKSEIKTANDAFEYFGTPKCVGCHSHQNEHDGRFNDRPELCTKCHVPGSANIKTPDHRDLSPVFAQQGAHATVKCDKCHGEGLAKLDLDDGGCNECHAKDDAHGGNLGTGCKSCHFEGFPWSQVVFDHDRTSKFKLEGRHEAVACNGCHVNAPKTYKPLEVSCVSCHGQQDKHQGALGESCEKCHDPAGGARLFDHNSMTDYVLEGKHARTACASCHYQRAPGAPRKKPGEALELNWKFEPVGRHCADCHGDPHGLRPGAQCQGCHDVESFHNARGSIGGGDVDAASVEKSALLQKPRHAPVSTVGAKSRDRYHERPPFSLQGGHSRLECNQCHGARGDLQGLGKVCDTCHRQDDIHASSLGPLCGECHGVRAWLPSRFTHTSVGFSLVGSHRLLACNKCHSAGNYMGVSGDCTSCHLDDALRAARTANTPHDAFVAQPCINCHNQVTWLVNPFFRRRN